MAGYKPTGKEEGSPDHDESEEVGEFVDKTTGLAPVDKTHPHSTPEGRDPGKHPHNDLGKKY